MPHFSICTINTTFQTEDEGAEYDDADAAYRAAVEAGIAMATDEVRGGKGLGVIAIHVQDDAGRVVARGMVSLATSPLIVC